jgi:ABC-type uncharacterized transport system substrate-binding protein
MNRRRILLAGAAGVLLPCARAFAQQPERKYRVAVLFSVPDAYNAPYRAALKERLAAQGFVEGKNLAVDARVPASTGFDFVRRQVAEILAAKPDAIFAMTTRVTEAALAETRSVPIVFAWVADPVTSGFVKEYARPGGNATGVSNRFIEVTIKRLGLLRELLPAAKRVVLAGPLFTPELEAATPRLHIAAQQLGFEPKLVNTGYGAQVSGIEEPSAQALLPLLVYSASGQRITGEQIVRLAAERRVATIFAESELVDAGGLMSFGTNLIEDLRRAIDMLAKVLRGAKPAELPVDQASRFELVINLKTARAIGIRIPQSLILRADRVIE